MGSCDQYCTPAGARVALNQSFHQYTVLLATGGWRRVKKKGTRRGRTRVALLDTGLRDVLAVVDLRFDQPLSRNQRN